jgi:cytochrome P450
MPSAAALAPHLHRLRRNAAVHSSNALARLAHVVGDPYGRLEHDPDLLTLGEEIRSRPFVRSRTGLLLTSRHDVCAAVLRTPYASAVPPEPTDWLGRLLTGPAPAPGHADPIRDSFVALDGEDHARLRRLVQPAFSRNAVARLEALTVRTAHALIDAMEPNDPVELVSAFAAPLPMTVICELLDVPLADRARFGAWGDALATGLDRPRSTAAARRIEAAVTDSAGYLGALVAERRARPGDDVLSLLAAGVDGDRLDDPSIVATATFLLIAGFETTVNLIGRGTDLLLAHPEQLAAVAADPDRLLPDLVEEALRYSSPVQYTFRTLTAAIPLPDGDHLPAGAEIVLLLGAANRDPAVFADPHRFDLTRTDARRHLAFGHGAHHCLGAALARLEAATAWRTLFERFDVDRWQRAGTTTPTAGRMIRGLATLPMRLGPDRGRPGDRCASVTPRLAAGG